MRVRPTLFCFGRTTFEVLWVLILRKAGKLPQLGYSGNQNTQLRSPQETWQAQNEWTRRVFTRAGLREATRSSMPPKLHPWTWRKRREQLPGTWESCHRRNLANANHGMEGTRKINAMTTNILPRNSFHWPNQKPKSKLTHSHQSICVLGEKPIGKGGGWIWWANKGHPLRIKHWLDQTWKLSVSEIYSHIPNLLRRKPLIGPFLLASIISPGLLTTLIENLPIENRTASSSLVITPHTQWPILHLQVYFPLLLCTSWDSGKLHFPQFPK